jgi:hypothetical protein
MRFIFLILILIPSMAFSKEMTESQIKERCEKLSPEKREKFAVCFRKKSPEGFYYSTKGDPFLGKTRSQSSWNLKLEGSLLGATRGFTVSGGYNFSNIEIGLFGGTLNSKENSEVGEYTGKYAGAFLSYHYLPSSKINPYMSLKLGGSSLVLKETSETRSYPYLGLGAGVDFPVTSTLSISSGLNLHQIIHPEKNLFHLGTSVNLGLNLNF